MREQDLDSTGAPAPTIVGAGAPAPAPQLRLHEVQIAPPAAAPKAGETRIEWLWEHARHLAEEAVQHADVLLPVLPRGEERKAAAVAYLRRAIDELEKLARPHLPRLVVAVTAAALRRAAPWLVEQAYQRLARLAKGGA